MFSHSRAPINPASFADKRDFRVFLGKSSFFVNILQLFVELGDEN
jgi:hypothetical protein